VVDIKKVEFDRTPVTPGISGKDAVLNGVAVDSDTTADVL